MNCATVLLDDMVQAGHGGRIAIRAPDGECTYAQLLAQANRIANVLVRDMGLKPGNRVLLRGPNNPMMAACWFAVFKAGGICVGTMPLLRAKELAEIIVKAKITHALCDKRLEAELKLALPGCPTLEEIRYWYEDGDESLDTLASERSPSFRNVDTSAEDVALIAFTSGTTGKPKGTMHFHRDVIAMCDCFPRSCLKPTKDDIFIGSPPLAFTFGLGGLLCFPMRFGASTALVEKFTPETLLESVQKFKATILFTAPTMYRVLAGIWKSYDLSSVKKCVSAGEALPDATRQLFKQASGIEIIDGIGSTEMIHIFISHAPEHVKRGATGHVIPGYTRLGAGRERRALRARPDRPPGGEGAHRLPLPRRRAAEELRGERLERHRRRLRHGHGRLLHLPGAHRRHDHLRRLQHRRARSGRRAARAPGGGRVRRGRQARCGARHDRFCISSF